MDDATDDNNLGDSLDDRLARLERRLDRIEAALGLPPPAAVAEPAYRLDERGAKVPAWPEPEVGPAAEVRPESGVGQTPPQGPVLPPRGSGVTAVPPPLPPVARRASRLDDTPPPRGSGFEQTVGLKWAGWAGAIVLVIGAALGIRFAYEQGWFGYLPPAARVAAMSLGGLALIAAGEVVYRRIGPAAAVGPFGAGVATLFVVSYAGYRYYGLYPRDAAFFLMGAVALVGTAVAVRGNLVSIAVLALIGGNVAPLALRTGEARLVPFLSYLLMLQAVALFLAWWGRGPKWWALRGLSLAILCLWMAPLVPDPATGPPYGTTFRFALVFAALFQAELIASAFRAAPPDRRGEAGAEDDTPAARARAGAGFGMAVTAAGTIAVETMLAGESGRVRGLWAIGLAAVCAAAGLALALAARRRAGRRAEAPETAAGLAALSTSFRLQAAALVVVAVPLALSGLWITAAWAVLAVVFGLAGAWLDLRVSRAAAAAVWALAVANLAVRTAEALIGSALGGGGGGVLAPWLSVLGHPVPAYAVIAWLLAVAGHVIAGLVQENWSAAAAAPVGATTASGTMAAPPTLPYESRAGRPARPNAGPAFRRLASWVDAAAVVLAAAAALLALPAPGATAALLAYAWLLLAARFTPRVELAAAGALVLGAAVLKWLLSDTLAARLDDGWDPSRYAPLLNPAAALGAAILASLAVLHLLRWPAALAERLAARQGVPVTPHSPGRQAGVQPPAGSRASSAPVHPGALARRLTGLAGFAAVLVLLWTGTMELDRFFEQQAAAAPPSPGAPGGFLADPLRAKQVAVSIFWSAYAVGCVVVGFRLRSAGLRYFGLALFAATLVKVVLVDLGQVQAGYRVLSFLGLGLLLLGTSVLYGKLSPLLLRARE